jgi:hypothetical protein
MPPEEMGCGDVEMWRDRRHARQKRRRQDGMNKKKEIK